MERVRSAVFRICQRGRPSSRADHSGNPPHEDGIVELEERTNVQRIHELQLPLGPQGMRMPLEEVDVLVLPRRI